MTATLPTTPRTTSGVTNGRYEIADCRVEDLVALIDAGLIRKNGRKSIEIRPPHIEIPDNLKGILE